MKNFLLAAALVASATALSASNIIFSDNFSGAPSGGVNDDHTTGLIYTGSPYTLTAGSIDVNQGSFYSWLCDSGALDSGNCLDTTGSGGLDGTIQATVTFPSAGQYQITVDLQGWDDTVNLGGPESTTVAISLAGGTLGSTLYSSSNFRSGVGGNDSYALITAQFSVSGPGTSVLTFQDTGAGQTASFAGAILDAAQISAVPEPATFVLAGAALLGLAGLRKRS